MMSTSTVPIMATMIGTVILFRQDGIGELRVTLKRQTGMQNTTGDKKTAVQDSWSWTRIKGRARKTRVVTASLSTRVFISLQPPRIRRESKACYLSPQASARAHSVHVGYISAQGYLSQTGNLLRQYAGCLSCLSEVIGHGGHADDESVLDPAASHRASYA